MTALEWMRLHLALYILLLVGAQGKRVQPISEAISEVLGVGHDVCEPEKGWFSNDPKWSDEKIMDRIKDKQEKAMSIAKWLGENHCFFGRKEGKMCLYQWYNLVRRILKFNNCAKIPMGDDSELSAMVWGNGDGNMMDFQQNVLNHMASGINNNKHVKKWLAPGQNCTFRFDLIKGEIEKNVETLKDNDASSEATQAVADSIIDVILGETCEYKKVWGLRKFRRKMTDNIVLTIHEARNRDVAASIARLQNNMDAEGAYFKDTVEKLEDDPEAAQSAADEEEEEEAAGPVASLLDLGIQAASLLDLGSQANDEEGELSLVLLIVVIVCSVIGGIWLLSFLFWLLFVIIGFSLMG